MRPTSPRPPPAFAVAAAVTVFADMGCSASRDAGEAAPKRPSSRVAPDLTPPTVPVPATSIPTPSTASVPTPVDETLKPAILATKSTPEAVERSGSELLFLDESGTNDDEADACLSSTLSSTISSGLKSTVWADRVRALEELDALLEARMSCFKSDDEPRQLFRASVAVLSKALHEKLVPVYLPAVGLLVKVFSDSLLAKVFSGENEKSAHDTIKAALGHLTPPVVLRAGSSNQRAREESAHALTCLCLCQRVGAAMLGPIVMRPLANRKSAHAAAGRIELLHALVLKAGINAPGLALRDVLVFTLPFVESASDKTRDAAQAVIREALAVSSSETIAFIEEHAPGQLDALKKRATQRKDEMASVLPVGAAVSSSGSRGKPKLRPIKAAGSGPQPSEDIIKVAGEGKPSTPAALAAVGS